MTDAKKPNLGRRTFVAAALAGAGSLAACGGSGGSSIALSSNETILFQGDSITDAGRDRDDPKANSRAALGGGYPLFLAGGLLADYPGQNLQVFNRGISGNKVPDLFERWQSDALATKSAPPEYWAADGVHPTVAGHALMAETWRSVTGL